MTIKNLYPKQRPAFLYNIINGKSELPLNSVFSRNSKGTYVNSSKQIVEVDVNIPRFNYDLNTGEFLGLLLEEGGANYALESDICPGNDYNDPNTVNTVESNVNTPAGIGDCRVLSITDASLGTKGWRIGTVTDGDGSAVDFSVYVKTVDEVSTTEIEVTCNRVNGPVKYTVGPEWSRIDVTGGKVLNASERNGTLFPTTTPIYIWGAQLGISAKGLTGNNFSGLATSYIRNTSSDENDGPAVRAEDSLSLFSFKNYDNGYSLLTDTEAKDIDYIYKIKADGTVISELENKNGTLEWSIDGVSAQTLNSFPQVGFVKGRNKTISSFGSADGVLQTNYLYTTGLSFPTDAVVPNGANEIEFGTPQTLKALYVWDGQLDETNAVSLIKGKYNIVTDAPIATDAYSFIYDPDPSSSGNTNVSFPNLIPTVSMTIDWGDGNSDSYAQDVTASHEFPYPGKYRVQVVADDGLDGCRVWTNDDQLYKVEAWHPDYRVDAPGVGFTGEQLVSLFRYQTLLVEIPKFKYTDLTSLNNTFQSCQALGPKDSAPYWRYVPYELPLCTTLSNAFKSFGYNDEALDPNNPAYSQFPQLQTSDLLVNVSDCFSRTKFQGWLTPEGSPTNKPFTNTSNVTNWTNCFYLNKATDLDIDTSSATTLASTFYSMGKIVDFPFIQTVNCESFSYTWYGCSKLETMPLINTSKGTTFVYAWAYCTSLETMPELDYSKSINMSNTWAGCTKLNSLPTLDLSENTSLYNTFLETPITESPVILNMSKCTTFRKTWGVCSNLTSWNNISNLDYSQTDNLFGTFTKTGLSGTVPYLNISNKCNTLQQAFGNTNITGFDPTPLDTSGCLSFRQAVNVTKVTEVPDWDYSVGTDFFGFAKNCNLLTDISPNVFDTTGSLVINGFADAFTGCALTATSIENLLVSLDTNGQTNIQLSINSGTNAAKSTWTNGANTAYDNLIAKGWSITFNS